MTDSLFMVEFVSGDPVDQVCQWRKEAGIFRLLANRGWQKRLGTEATKTWRKQAQQVGTFDRECDQAGEKETRTRLIQFPYGELERVGINESLALAVILTIENWLRVEKYSLADQAREELTKLGLSTEVAKQLVASRPGLKQGRRARLQSTKQSLPLRPGPTPWPAPYVSTLVFDAMLKRREKRSPDLINQTVNALGGSPDQLDRYRNRLTLVKTPPPSFAQGDASQISIIQWLAISFEHYPCCWTEKPQQPYYYVPDGLFFEGLSEEAITRFVKDSING